MLGRKGISVRVALALPALWPLSALAANPQRHIPRGEDNPQVIEKVFDSPVGEVQFLVSRRSERGGYLRNAKGHLAKFTEVRGGRDCEEWFLSNKETELPRNCEFLFYDDYAGRYFSVRSYELEESTIFGVASGRLRARRLAEGGL